MKKIDLARALCALCATVLVPLALYAADEAHSKPGDGQPEPAPALSVLAPNGGEVLEPGSSYMIKWECISWPSAGGYDVQVSGDGGKTFIVVASGVSGDCSYEWKVDAPGSSNCVVRVLAPIGEGRYIYDDSNTPFTIKSGGNDTATLDKRKMNSDKPTQSKPANDPKPVEDPVINPQLRVNAPNGGESYEAGSKIHVGWKCEPTAVYYNVSISYDGGKSYTKVGHELNEGCSWEWESGMTASDNCLVRVEAKTATGVIMDDVSDAAFKITTNKKVDTKSPAHADQ